jgi:uncharacterized protein (DUF1800 family)
MDRKSALKHGLSWLKGTPTNAPQSTNTATDAIQLPTLAASTSLDPFIPTPDMPWDRRRILHLTRRMGLSPTTGTMNFLSGFSPSAAVDHLINTAINAQKITEPAWSNIGAPPANATEQERQAYNQQRNIWINEFRNTLSRHILDSGLNGKMTLFWHNHFVTEFSDYGNNPQYAWRYIKTIQDHQFGNFKQLTLSIGLTPAMLLYLNGNQNQRVSPNENYARELLELFTLGEGIGYTQHDIEELARALTGYQVNNQTLAVTFNTNRFDNAAKTIFGKTGNYNYTTVHDLIFNERSELIAQHVCREAYNFFVYPNAPDEIVNQLAQVFISSGMQIEPMLRVLFKSKHFFDDELIGSMVSSPVEHFGNFMSMLEVPRNNQDLRNLFNYSSQTGQFLLQPPDVSGWRGHRNWLDTSTLPTRWNLMQQNVNLYRTQLLEFAKRMPSPNNAYQLARDIASWMIAVPLTDEEYTTLGNVLLGGSPSYEWRIDSDGASSRVQALVAYIVLMPEFQLN